MERRGRRGGTSYCQRRSFRVEGIGGELGDQDGGVCISPARILAFRELLCFLENRRDAGNRIGLDTESQFNQPLHVVRENEGREDG